MKKRANGFLIKLMASVIQSLFVCFACFSCAFSNIQKCPKDEYISQQIVQNSKKNGCTFWTIRTVNDRFNWLGGDLKSEFYALSEPWCAIKSDNYNYSFFYTSASLNSSFIFISEDNKIPVNIFASPSPGALNHLNIKLKSKQSANTKSNFYLSESLFNKINSYNCELEIIERQTHRSNKKTIEFNRDVVTGFNNSLISSICGENYIIINYYNSYDMANYTGDSMLISVFKKDFYQNHFYYSRTSSMQNQYKSKVAYLSSYHDTLEAALNYSLDDFDHESRIQNLHESNEKIVSHTNPFFPVFLVFSIILPGLISFAFVKWRKEVLNTMPIAACSGAMVYIVIHFISSIICINKTARPLLFYWTSHAISKGFIFAIIFASIYVIAFFVLRFLLANKNDNNKNKNIMEVDI